MEVGSVLEWAGYASVAAIVAVIVVFVVDHLLDFYRSKTGKLKGEAWMVFDQFCDTLRKIVGSGALAGLTEQGVRNTAGKFWDLTQGVIAEVWSRDEFVVMVMAWYADQVRIEQATAAAYEQSVPTDVRVNVTRNGGGPNLKV